MTAPELVAEQVTRFLSYCALTPVDRRLAETLGESHPCNVPFGQGTAGECPPA